MFVVMDNDTTIKLVKAFAVAFGQVIDDLRGILVALLLGFVILYVCLPDLIFQGMKKFDRWKKRQEE